MKNSLILIFSLSLVSCSPSLVKVDTLNAAFLAKLNNKDSTEIMNMIGNNSAVIDNSLTHVGSNAIANEWVSKVIKVRSNIKTKSTISKWEGNVAFDAGTYTFDVTSPAGSVSKEDGNYSFVWNRQNDGEWKLMLIHLDKATPPSK